MRGKNASVVLVHGAWADGSSWNKVIASLWAMGINVVAAPLPLTSLADDVAALDRTLERVEGPVVLVGHAYAGAVIGATDSAKVSALIYIAALAPDEGETVADVFYRAEPHPMAPKLAPDSHGLIWLPATRFRRPSRNMLRLKSKRCSPPSSGRLRCPASASRSAGRFGRTGQAGFWWPRRIA